MEKIIINGVDVSGCEYLQKYFVNDIEENRLETNNIKYTCNHKDCKWSLCSENHYCQYRVDYVLKLKNKQLKRKEKEIEGLQEQIFIYDTDLNLLKEKYANKEKKCKELKKDLRNVEKDRAWIKERCIDAGKELGKYSYDWDGKEKNLVIQALHLNELYEKQQQALEKIEEVCKCSKEPMNCDKCPQCGDCEELCVNDENLQDIILQIIKECKE